MEFDPKKLPVTDTGIVTCLRSDDPEMRRAGLDALFLEDEGTGALMVRVRGEEILCASTTRLDAGRCFNGLLFLAEQVGAAIGLKLGWLPKPPDTKKKIVLARPNPFGS